ncbi:MAG TPA: hypothetical protein VK705_08085 [Ferruginibacter sp.]|nr:hypothetical protein [Ferruginibacter sp.]
MEFAGFILLFMGLVYAIYPRVNSLWPSKDKSKTTSKDYLKSIRIAGFVSIVIGVTLLICNFLLNY